MSIFLQIEASLVQFADKQQAVLTQDRENTWPHGAGSLGFEERRIDWQRDGINLAIIIQPDFNAAGVDTSKWNFVAVAWHYQQGHRYTTCQELATSVPFWHIEAQAAHLLAEADAYLSNIFLSDLLPPPYLGDL